MKIWLDAKRVPEHDWVWVTTAQCAIRLLSGGCVESISFAPDQKKIVSPVIDWIVDNRIELKRSVHSRVHVNRTGPLMRIRIRKQ